jgi:hypothetical protein
VFVVFVARSLEQAFMFGTCIRVGASCSNKTKVHRLFVKSLLASLTLACYKMIATCSRLFNNWEEAVNAVRTHFDEKL